MALGQSTPRPRFWRDVASLWRLDAQRFRMSIAVVAGLELFRAALAEWVLHRGPLLSDQAFGGASGAFEFQMLDGALWLAMAVTTAIVVQADHPADDRAFLRSRPVGPWLVAVAKLTLFAALAVVLPFVLTAARLVAYGAPSVSIAASSVQFVVMGGAVVLPAWALALVTRTLPRFLAAAAALAVVWSVSITAIVSLGPGGPFDDDLIFRVTNRQMLHTFAPPLTDWQRVDARGWLFALACTVLASVILASYYRSRRPIATALAAGALIAAPALAPAPIPSLPAAPDLVGHVAGGLRLPALVVPSAALMEKLAGVGRDEMLVFGDVLLPPLPANVSTDRKLGRVHLTGPGIDLWTEGLALLNRDAGRASGAAAHSTEPVWKPEADGEMLFYLPRRDIGALRDRRVNVEAPVDLQFTRHVLVADVPLRAGIAFRTDAYLIEVLSVYVDPQISYVLCRFTRFPSLARSHPNVMAFIAHPDGRVVRVQAGMRPGFDPDFPDEHRVGWAHGRTWTRQRYLPIADLAAGPEARLRIVESRPAGGTRARVDARDVPVRNREPRPPVTTPMSILLGIQ